MIEKKANMNGKKPNIVYILTDDQRFDTIQRLYGGQIMTPVLDELTKEGMSFTEATIMGGSQPAVCCPSRNMLLTGRGLYEIEGQSGFVAPDVVTLPQHLQSNGYTSYHVGKWHQDMDTHKRSFNGGKGMWIGMKDTKCRNEYMDHFDTVVHDYNEEGRYDETNWKYEGTPYTSMAPYARYGDYRHSTTVFTDAAIDVVKEHESDNPYFIFLAYTAPHDPRQYPTEYFEMYKDMEIELPENYMANHPFDNGELFVRDELLAGHPRLSWEIQEHIRDYYGIITHLDDEMGRLIEALKAKGDWENTILVMCGDNGLAVGQHGLMGKQNVYEHSIRVPLIMTGPGVPKDKVSRSQCYLSDIYPTLCSMIGIDVPSTVTGLDFSDAFVEKDYSLRDSSYHAYMHLQRSFKKDGWKLNLYKVDGHYKVQLYNLEEDPKEMTNLATDAAHKETLMKMFKEMESARMDYKDYGTQGSDFWQGFNKFVNDGDYEIKDVFKPMGGAQGRGGNLCF